MMTWACLVHPLLPGLLQQGMAGLVLGPTQHQTLAEAARTGKLLLGKPLGEVGAAHSRSALPSVNRVCSAYAD